MDIQERTYERRVDTATLLAAIPDDFRRVKLDWNKFLSDMSKPGPGTTNIMIGVGIDGIAVLSGEYQIIAAFILGHEHCRVTAVSRI